MLDRTILPGQCSTSPWTFNIHCDSFRTISAFSVPSSFTVVSSYRGFKTDLFFGTWNVMKHHVYIAQYCVHLSTLRKYIWQKIVRTSTAIQLMMHFSPTYFKIYEWNTGSVENPVLSFLNKLDADLWIRFVGVRIWGTWRQQQVLQNCGITILSLYKSINNGGYSLCFGYITCVIYFCIGIL